MNIKVQGKNGFIPSESIEKYSEKKLEKVLKLIPEDDVKVRVVCKVYNDMQKVEITLTLPKITMRAEVEQKDIYAAIDLAVDKLLRQLTKQKDKFALRFSKNKNRGIKEENAKLADAMAKTSIYGEDIVRVKSITLEPITVDEAIFKMETLDHSFYIFKNVENEKVCVIYRRNEGNLAVIETE